MKKYIFEYVYSFEPFACLERSIVFAVTEFRKGRASFFCIIPQIDHIVGGTL